MRWRTSVALLGVLLWATSASAAGLLDGLKDEDFEEQPLWQENAVQLPPAPQDTHLYSFYVSPTTTHRFFVDIQNLSVGNDGVVRYTLVILSPSGAKNVSFEGMRCEARARRIYASGRADGSWSPSKNERWLPVREAVANRQHAALFTDFFCPGGVMNYRLEEIQKTFKKEGRPLSEAPS
jgi:hypothetical protein